MQNLFSDTPEQSSDRKKRKLDDSTSRKAAKPQKSNDSASVGPLAAYNFVIEDLRRHGLSTLAGDLARGNPHTKRDPVSVLGKDLCHHIFSFLCEKPDIHKENKKKIGLTKKEWLCGVAGKLYSQLRSVSLAWKATFDGVAWADWVGTVDVKLLERVDSKQSLSFIDWLCHYKVRLGYVVINRNINRKQLPVFTKLITECQTKRLSGLYFATEELHKIHPAAEKNLHDMIAGQCPSIKNLRLSLWLPTNTPIYKDYVSKALFSIPSITWLCINLDFRDDIGPAAVDPKWGTKTPIQGRVITNLIQNLPNLRDLEFFSVSESRMLHCKNQRFHIESKTLEHLKATDFFKGAVVSLDCPALKQFQCDGGPNGNGCLPNNQFSRGRYQSILAQNVNGGNFGGNFSLKTRARRRWMASPLLQVPNGCELFIFNFGKWGELTNGYDELMQRSNEFANATYQTFGEE